MSKMIRQVAFIESDYIIMKLVLPNYYLSPDDGRSISRNVASLNAFVHDLINLLYYEHRTDKRKYFYKISF